MEFEAKKLLIDKLDDSLLAHAAALGQKGGGPTILDAYQLQGLAERHYYLKVEHEFTAAEVEALLSFDDPLAVADACWEENTHKHSFPICELLDSINAYQRFSPKAPDRPTPEQEIMVKAAMELEFWEFHDSVMGMNKEEIIGKSAEITAMREALDFMQNDYKFEPGDVETFLHLEKPLHFVASLWPTEVAYLMDMPNLLSEELAMQREYQKDKGIENQKPAQPEKPSVREQLRAAMKQARQQPVQEERAKDGGAR